MSARRFRYVEVAETLRENVSDGRYGVSGMLPSEATLSDEYHVSRVTVRKALELLRSEGRIDARQGFGWFVRSDPVRQSLTSLDTLDRQLAVAGVESSRRILSFGFEAPTVEVGELLSSETVLQVRRLGLAAGEPFVLITVWCDEKLGAQLSRSDVAQRSFLDLIDVTVGSATQAIGASVADQPAAKTLEVPVGSPLLRVRRVTRDVAGQNVLVSEHLYPAHRMEFAVELSPNDSDDPQGLRLV